MTLRVAAVIVVTGGGRDDPSGTDVNASPGATRAAEPALH